MDTGERRGAVVDVVNELEEVTIDFLKKRFNVSKSTIYRDLMILNSEGGLRKTSKGAIKTEEFLIENDSYFANGLKVKNIEKAAIAKKALEYVKNDESIILDAGTVNFMLAKELKKSDFFDLTIITNNIITQLLLVKNRNLRVVAPGGLIMEGCYSALGDFIESMLEKMKVEKAFITTKGISLDGQMTEFEFSESKIKQLFIKRAKQKILMVNSSKFGRMGIYNVANVRDFNVLITDSGIKKEYLDMLEKSDIEVIIVDH